MPPSRHCPEPARALDGGRNGVRLHQSLNAERFCASMRPFSAFILRGPPGPSLRQRTIRRTKATREPMGSTNSMDTNLSYPAHPRIFLRRLFFSLALSHRIPCPYSVYRHSSVLLLAMRARGGHALQGWQQGARNLRHIRKRGLASPKIPTVLSALCARQDVGIEPPEKYHRVTLSTDLDGVCPLRGCDCQRESSQGRACREGISSQLPDVKSQTSDTLELFVWHLALCRLPFPTMPTVDRWPSSRGGG